MGARINISVSGRGGQRVSWSAGQDFGTSSGIAISAAGGSAVQLSRLRISAEIITILLSPSDNGGGTVFTLQLFLAASPAIQQFTLALSADAGTQVSAALPMQQPLQLSEPPTIFDWSGQ